ncbi:MAG: bifunctional precorrin-2 dehydrogenase/sirohydrochlorin ferrochelatase [Methanocalculus sp. MSAO_Arc1]|uniref:precorrin-2 dehydrogenase/sirohydrochlorin ferrochelatase family protein n=1 Tax=Methanocalculus TaxID=71151 RepID=UPI000FF686C9|nr:MULTISPECIES: bifunctional precorrin-2 dehydrogenase/sirohydrochlorin ferrochelatase [unclassified Methanocalculus]MCP1662803.1 precorrin-2 dehydrogenase/sirohydrochlorin ferrochelatase [Methanocalculus sp. AMF5]RQD79031.1 MAG: bifunctional precorrin-2 dehydrogenase/sirohydrochlorin ferrochelatase [Methanocalculus sp. MSAO_Arc1]
MIPLIISFKHKKVIIFGGGSVSARKARYFLGEAEVTIISRSFSEEIRSMPITRLVADTGDLSDEEIRSHIIGAFLVIAATSERSQNNRIGKLAAEENTLFNNADGEAGDVIIPSVVRGRHLIAGFSTGGGSPAVSRHLRERFVDIIPEIDNLVDLQQVLREALKKTSLPQEERAQRLHAALADSEIQIGLVNNKEETIRKAKERYCHE